MNDLIIENAFNILSPVIKEVGVELKKMFFDRNFKIESKSKEDWVTSADKLSEELILKTIKKYFPDHSILSEESGETLQNSKYLWVVDPLDGTTNFTYHNPFFAISVALIYEKEPVLAMVYNPILDEFYWAKKGQGAYLDDVKLQVNNNDDLNNLRLTYCHGPSREAKEKAIALYSYFKREGDIRQLGAAALELSLLARAFTDAFMIPGVLAWDVAAGALLVKEAGGSVVDFEGNDWNIESKDILATNGKINDYLLSIIQKVV